MTPYRIIQILQTYSIVPDTLTIGDAVSKKSVKPADLPFYELRGNGLRVHFKALQSALVAHPKSPNRHNVGLDVGIADRILELFIDNPKITMAETAEKLNVAKRTIEREVKQLRETGHVERIGSKRFGHWKIRVCERNSVKTSDSKE
mgnify:CR=1 FL=1